MQYNLFNNDYCGKIHLSQYVELGCKARTLSQCSSTSVHGEPWGA